MTDKITNALNFYADATNWRNDPPGMGPSAVDKDGGKRAADAIESLKPASPSLAPLAFATIFLCTLLVHFMAEPSLGYVMASMSIKPELVLSVVLVVFAVASFYYLVREDRCRREKVADYVSGQLMVNCNMPVERIVKIQEVIKTGTVP